MNLYIPCLQGCAQSSEIRALVCLVKHRNNVLFCNLKIRLILWRLFDTKLKALKWEDHCVYEELPQIRV